MPASTHAGKRAPKELLVNIEALLEAYYANQPNPDQPGQRVAFGTSGHRGTSLDSSFTETHILAITQAVCEYRKTRNIEGPLFVGLDTHALSAPAQRTAIEVLAANGVHTLVHAGGKVTPTPVISFSILEYNRGRSSGEAGRADGVVITPSHNPPEDGGFKYNPPHGGPADTDATGWIEKRANALIREGLRSVRRLEYQKALACDFIKEYDYITPYVSALAQVVDMRVVAAAGLRLGADALGGSSGPFWAPIAEKYGFGLDIMNAVSDPQFSFMSVDRDGKIRMDCSSPWAMAGLIEHSARFDLAFGNDPDSDRHGIVTPGGLMNPNHYLAAAAAYLYRHRPGWNEGRKTGRGLGKTLVTSGMLDRVAASLGTPLYEVPVGFKWFVEPLLGGECAFACEESAGASFLRFDGGVWSTDKDGIIMDLLAAEMTAVTGKTPDLLYRELTDRFGVSCYERQDAPASQKQKDILKNLSPADLKAEQLAGDPITGVFTRAPGNNAPIGGLKVSTANGWFAARPSGTEDVYKIYAESFLSQRHLEQLKNEARALVDQAFLAG
ncbi:MAG: phosphoglucomutase (alpha-D-glucose-1,6-bisphosphate-dependent) [Deltaproteobacteria bacterium]|jgi:phosphoglucomutase|nr:phosphoglucomutase (alpha-D-glucose-1,6-bisphosphate-dependent) [Deltaproteobacteria bacterium]